MKFRALLAIILSVATATFAFGQKKGSGNGSIVGTVLDAAEGYPLTGATVRIEGTGLGAITDLDGNYSIRDVPAGTYSVVISYISYLTNTVEKVVVTAHKSTVLDSKLSTDEKMLGEVVVEAEGNNETESLLLLNQKQSLIATQAIGAHELSRKGISDAEAAVAQIPGISRQEGQKNVFVRGLGDRYNTTTLNGFPLPSDDPESKNISLNIFETDMLRSVGVSKAFTASQTAEVGGAIIDIQSKKLVGDRLFRVSADAGVNTSVLGNNFYRPDGTSYWGISNRDFVFEPGEQNNDIPAGTPNPMSNSLTPRRVNAPIDHSFGLMAGKRFKVGDNNSLSMILVANHTVDNSFSNRISRNFNSVVSKVADASYIFESAQTGTVSTTDTRQIVMGNATLDLGKRHSIEYNFLGIHSNNRYYIFTSGSGGEYTEPENDFGQSVIFENARDNYLMVNQLLSHWAIADKLKLSVGASYGNLRGYEPDRRKLYFNKSVTGDTLKDKKSTWSLGAGNSNFRYNDILKENQLTVRAGFDWAYADKSSLTIGYDFQMYNHDFVNRAVQLNGDRTQALSMEELEAIDFSNIFKYDRSKPNGGIYDPNTTIYFRGDKKVHSPYIEVNHTLSDRWSVNLGVRADFVEQRTIYGQNELPKDAAGTLMYDSVQFRRPIWLPSVNIKYAINDEHTLRLSASRSYAVPRFKEFSQYNYIGLDYTVYGWPFNKVSYFWNADLKYDWYLSDDEYLTVGVFYKHLTDPMGKGYFGGPARKMEYRRTAEEANVAGAEVDFKKNLLDFYNEGTQERHKLTLGLNASYLFSNLWLNFPETNHPSDKSNFPAKNARYTQLESASPLLANGDLTYTYTKGAKSYSAALLLSYFCDRIYAYGSIDMSKYDLVEKGIPTLNFVASVDLTDKLSIKLKVNNLLNPHYTVSQLANDIIRRELSTQNPDGLPILQGSYDDIYEFDDPYIGTDFGKPYVVRDFRYGISFSLGLTCKF